MMNNLFNIKNTALPKDVRLLLNLGQVDNFSLKLFKCANFFNKDKPEDSVDISTLIESKKVIKPAFYVKKYKTGKKFDEQEWYLNVTIHDFNTDDLKYCQFQTKLSVEGLCSKHEAIPLTTDWRLAIGIGNASVFENGITLHHIYGFPYLPASSIKGITNHYAHDMLKDENENEKLGGNKVTKKDYNDIFGTEKNEGKIIFFDAYPQELANNSVQPDIMNNHYQDYYTEGKAPADWLSPNPVLFLTLKDVAFTFYIGIKKDADAQLLEKTKSWLESALKEKGIGAKTAVGYGYIK
ncbi:MAG TPA: type III-B CRISPR module RAMP protein Cmr6 [Chitinophagales bacterium]|nr:type III-B CRISPR module RAMP protein Cmr6 [Chitinophagales bacterium]